MDTLLGILILFSTFAVSLAGEYCYTSYYTTKYCSYGCCGSFPDEYCCGVYVWAIVLAILGSIFFISFIIIVVCCIYKKKGHNGRVMATNAQTVTTVNYVNQPGFQPNVQQYGYMQQPQGYQPPPGYQQSLGFQPPPAYASASSYPPPVGSSDPAYPPPPPKY